MATIYRKTAKGQAEIETRAHRLPPRLRGALILVDGRRSDEELQRLIAAQPLQTLQELNEQAFIEIIGIAAAPVPRATAVAPAVKAAPVVAAPAAASTPMPAPQAALAAVDFSAVRAAAVRNFTELVGPMSEALAIKMERARNAVELRPIAEMACKIVGNTRGGQAAAEFRSKYIATL